MVHSFTPSQLQVIRRALRQALAETNQAAEELRTSCPNAIGIRGQLDELSSAYADILERIK